MTPGSAEEPLYLAIQEEHGHFIAVLDGLVQQSFERLERPVVLRFNFYYVYRFEAQAEVHRLSDDPDTTQRYMVTAKNRQTMLRLRRGFDKSIQFAGGTRIASVWREPEDLRTRHARTRRN